MNKHFFVFEWKTWMYMMVCMMLLEFQWFYHNSLKTWRQTILVSALHLCLLLNYFLFSSSKLVHHLNSLWSRTFCNEFFVIFFKFLIVFLHYMLCDIVLYIFDLSIKYHWEFLWQWIAWNYVIWCWHVNMEWHG